MQYKTLVRPESLEDRLKRLAQDQAYRTAIKQDLLTIGWDQVVHITFRLPTYLDLARRMVVKFFADDLNREKELYFKNRMKGFFAFEEHSMSRRVHVHALLLGIPSELDFALELRCNARFGKSTVNAFDEGLAEEGCRYVADSCIPGGSNWMWRTINSKYRCDPATARYREPIRRPGSIFLSYPGKNVAVDPETYIRGYLCQQLINE
jgi:hypothetical protein